MKAGSKGAMVTRFAFWGRTPMAPRIVGAATRPVPALPLDALRILLAVIGLLYFLETIGSSGAFSNPDGFIDHGIVHEAFWYTQLSAFPPGVGLGMLRLVFGLACLACVLLAAGYRPRLMAVLLYLVAVSTYRWNFAVMYLDDATIHLVFFWLMLLPTGTTLTIGEWRSRGADVWPAWKQRWVSGLVLRCFLANIALLYLVAGLWKWTSPMWRDGTALYVGLQTPVSRAPDFWTPGWLPVLMLASYFALVIEPLLPAMFVLPAHHRLKWVLFGGALALHFGILITMKIPYTNAVLIAVSVVTFREEIMGSLHRGGTRATEPVGVGRVTPRGVVAVGFVALLSVAMISEIPVAAWRQPPRATELAAAADLSEFGNEDPARAEEVSGLWAGHNPLYVPLWAIGIAQSYRLFDWIDDRNWDIRYDIVVTPPAGPPAVESADRVFGDSIRHILLQSYVHGVRWGPLAGRDLVEFRRSVLDRYATRYCASDAVGEGTTVDVFTLIRRITKENSVDRERTRELLMSFRCADEQIALTYVAESVG